MNSRFSRLVLGMITTTVLVAGAASCGQAQSDEQQMVAVKKGDIAVTVASDGNLSLITDRKLTFETSGKVIEVTVEEGDDVIAGQVLARLDTESLEMTIAQAGLAVKAAGLDLEMATDNFKKITYPYTYYTFALGIPDSLAAIEDAERNMGYIKEKIGASITAEDLSALQTELKSAMDSLTTAREKLGRGEGADVFLSGQLPISSFWTLRDTQLTMEKALVALDKAKNDLERATDELDKTVITAPFDGEIVQVNVEEGDTLSQGEYAGKVAFYMVDPGDLELRGTVDEIDIAGVVVGQEAVITLDALPDMEVPGEVTYISPVSKVEGGVVVYDVRIKLEHEDRISFKSGMTAKADIITLEKTGVLVLPDRAISKHNGKTTVKIMTGDGVEDREIVTGTGDGNNTEVVSGLVVGESVVIERKTN